MNVGSLIAYLDLDDSNFDRKTKNANRQIDGLKLHLETLEKMNPKVDVEVRTKTAALDVLQGELADLKARAAEGADVKVETAEAMFKLAALKGEIRSLHAEAMKGIKIEANSSELDRMNAALDNTIGKLKGISGGPGGILGALLTVGPALLPVGSAITGVMAGISGGALEAAGAVGILATAIKGLDGGVTAYGTYQQAVATANHNYDQALAAAGAKSGKARTSALSAANAAHQKALGTAQFNLNQSAYGKMSGAGQQFVQYDVNTVQPFKHSLSNIIQAGVTPGLTGALHGVIGDAPQITTAITEISGAVGHLLAQAGTAMQSPFWKQWLQWFGKDSAHNIQILGRSLGDVTQGLARGMQGLSPVTHTVLSDIESLSKRFDHWTGSPAFTQWVTHVEGTMHEVDTAIKAISPDLHELFKGMQAAGGVELQAITEVFQAIGNMPAGVLQVAGAAIPPIFLAMKGANLIGNATDGLKKFLAILYPVAGAATAATAAEDGLTASMEANTAASEANGAAQLSTGEKLKSWGAKAALAAGGALMLTNGLTGAHNAAGTLQDAMGGAAIGATFGPWGAAVGGAVGGLVGLAAQFFHAGDAARTNYAEIGRTQAINDATSGMDALGASLDQVTAKYGQTTRAAVLNELQTTASGKSLLAYLSARGVSSTEAVSAVMGTNKTATKDVRKALGSVPAAVTAADQNVQNLKNLYNNGNYTTDANGNQAVYLHGNSGPAVTVDALKAQIAAAQEYQRNINNLSNALPQFTSKLRDEQAQIRRNAIVTGDLNAILMQSNDQLKAWPKQLLTVIQAKGTDQTMKGILGIVAAAQQMPGWKSVGGKAAISEATVIVNSDPSIAHTKQNILDVANALAGIPTSKTVSLSIAAPAVNMITSSVNSVVSALGKPRAAHAGGTPFTFHSDMLVGEMGPEILRNVPKGSQIIPNNQTRQILAGHGGGATAPRMHPADLQALAHLLGAAAAQHAHDAVHNALSRY